MVRALRIEYAGARYHIMCRGNHGQRIFKSQSDADLFIKTLGEACARNQVVVHAWCLMGNHYHLLLETPQGNLVGTMKWFQGTVTQRYNARHKLWGHLFQGRYKAKVIDDLVVLRDFKGEAFSISPIVIAEKLNMSQQDKNKPSTTHQPFPLTLSVLSYPLTTPCSPLYPYMPYRSQR